MVKQIIAVLIVFLAVQAGAQSSKSIRHQKDSLRKKLSRDSADIFRKRLAKPFFKFENRYSFVSNEHVNLFGIMGGVTFIEKHTFFTGYFFLDTRQQTPITFKWRGINAQNYLDMRYFVFGYQYVIYNKRYFQVCAPVAVGFGTYKVEITNSSDKLISTRRGFVLPTNLGLQFVIKPFQAFGLSASGGYRFIGDKKNTDLVLRGWYYSFGIWIDGRQVYRSLRYMNKKREYRRDLRLLLGP